MLDVNVLTVGLTALKLCVGVSPEKNGAIDIDVRFALGCSLRSSSRNREPAQPPQFSTMHNNGHMQHGLSSNLILMII